MKFKNINVKLARRLSLIVTSAMLLQAGSTQASTNYWVGTAANSLFNSMGNWSNGASLSAPTSLANGDTLMWDGYVTGDLWLTNNSSLSDANPGYAFVLKSTQTNAVQVASTTGRVRFQSNAIVVEAGAGALTFGSNGTASFPCALGGTGNSGPHWMTNNSTNPVTFGTDTSFVCGGGGSHQVTLYGSGNFIFRGRYTGANSGNGVSLVLATNYTGTMSLGDSNAPSITYAGTADNVYLRGGTLKLIGASAIGTNGLYASARLYIYGGALDSGVENLVLTTNPVTVSGNFGFVGTQGLTITGNTTLSANSIVAVSNNTLEITGPISGSYSLTKAGSGTLSLGGANTYTGGTILSNGTLKIASSSAIPGTISLYGGTLDLNGNSTTIGAPSGAANVTCSSGNAILTISSTSDATFSGAISSSLGLVKNGTGYLTLAGTNTYVGDTTINGGALLISGLLQSAGLVTVNSGGGFGGTNTVSGSVSWQTGSSAIFTLTPTSFVSGSNTTPFVVSGTSTFNGAVVVVNVAGSKPLQIGTYTLMTCGSASDSPSASPTYTGAGVKAGTRSIITVSGGKVILTVTLTGNNSVWNVDGDGNWSAGTDWSGNYVPSVSGDSATLGLGTAFRTISLNQNASVAAIEFTNNNSFAIASAGGTLTFANPYGDAIVEVIGGTANAIAAPITLATNLQVTAASGTSIALNNTITVPTDKQLRIIGQGTVEMNANNSYGTAGTVSTILGDIGTLSLLQNSALGAGDLSVISNSTIRVGADITVANNINISSNNTVTVDNNGHNATLSGAIGGKSGVSAIGSGTLTLSGINTFSNGLSITGGTLKPASADAIPYGSAVGVVTVSTNGVFDLNGKNITLNGLVSSDNSAIVGNTAGTLSALSIISTNTNYMTTTFAGTIQGSVRLVKDGVSNSTFIVSGTNTFTGGAYIESNNNVRVGTGVSNQIATLGSGKITNNGTLTYVLDYVSNSIKNDIVGYGLLNIGTGGCTNAEYTIGGNMSDFTGNVEVGCSNLYITNANAFGHAASGTNKIIYCRGNYVSQVTKMHFIGLPQDIIFDDSYIFQLSGEYSAATGIGEWGPIYNDAGSNTINGLVNMDAGANNTRIVVATNTFLTLAGTVRTVAQWSGRTLVLDGSGNGLVSGGIYNNSNTTSVLKTGAGTWTLSNSTNAYTGTTIVSNGTLVVSGCTGSGAVTVLTNATLTGTGVIAGALTMNAGAKASITINPQSGYNLTPLICSNSITLNSNPVSIYVEGSTPLSDGSYMLLAQSNTSATVSGTFTLPAIISGAGVDSGKEVSIVSSSFGVKLVITTLNVWTNNADGDWTVGDNWNTSISPNGVAANATLGYGTKLIKIIYDIQGDLNSLYFTNANSFVITNSEGANPLMYFNSTASDAARLYVKKGTANAIAVPMNVYSYGAAVTLDLNVDSGAAIDLSGPIASYTSTPLITMSGNGTVKLSGDNSGYLGAITVSGPRLVLGNANALGTTDYGLKITSATLDSSVPNLVLNRDGSAGKSNILSGTIGFTGTQSLNIGSSSNILTSAITFNIISNTLAFGGGMSGAYAITISTNSTNGTLQLDGPNSFTGGVIFNTGTVSVGSDTALGTGKFDMPTVAPVYIKSSTSDARIIPNELGMGSGGFTTIGDGNLTFTGLISSYNGTKTYTISNPVTVLASYLTNHAGGSIKNGPGTFIMTASNLNSGGVTVNQGVLGIGHSNTLGTGTLTMNGGALMTTIAGLSNWNNNIQVWNTNFSFVGTNDLYLGTGAVTVNYAVTLTNNTTNTLVVGGSISGTGTLAKTGTGLVVLSGTTNALTNVAISGGTLEIDNPGLSSQCTLSIASGATLKLGFFASGVSCTVSELYLGGVKQAAGVYDSTTSPTYITGTGRIQVTPYVYIPTGSYQLTNSFNITTSTLTLSWQGGQNWKLQAQTNDLATGITNNWSDVVTDTTVSNYSIAVYPTNPTVFYRLYWQQ